MGRIKELRLKAEEGSATDEEKEELETLEGEAKETEENTDEDKKVSELVSKFLTSVEAKIAEKKDEKVNEVEEKKKELDALPKEERIKQFITALIQNDKVQMKVLSEGTNADGGFLVPQEWELDIVEEMRDDSVIRPLATVISPCPKQLNIAQLATRPIVKFRGEKSIKDTSTLGFTQIALTPYSLACIVPLTKELVEDAEVGGNIVALVTRVIGTAIAEREDKAFAVGSGTNEPTGIDNYSGTVARSVTTPANVLTSDSLIETFYRLGQKYRKRAVWLMNGITLTKAMQLKDSQNRYLFIPDPTGQTPGTLLGRPVLEQNDLPLTRIWLGDLRGYWIGDRHGIAVDQSEEATLEGIGNLWERNMVAVRVEKRVDGEMADTNAFAVLNGTN